MGCKGEPHRGADVENDWETHGLGGEMRGLIVNDWGGQREGLGTCRGN